MRLENPATRRRYSHNTSEHALLEKKYLANWVLNSLNMIILFIFLSCKFLADGKVFLKNPITGYFIFTLSIHFIFMRQNEVKKELSTPSEMVS